MRCAIAHRLEGSRFGMCPVTPRFCLNANTAETRENRRLPLMSQRDAIIRGLRFAYTRTVELPRAG